MSGNQIGIRKEPNITENVMTGIMTYFSIITLNDDILNTSIKRHRLIRKNETM
jgi:hypothetical protein